MKHFSLSLSTSKGIKSEQVDEEERRDSKTILFNNTSNTFVLMVIIYLNLYLHCGLTFILTLWANIYTYTVGYHLYLLCGLSCVLTLWANIYTYTVGYHLYLLCGLSCVLTLWANIYTYTVG